MSREAAKTVMPIVTVDSVDDVRDSYRDKLGFTQTTGVMGADGKLDMVALALDGARLTFARPRAKMDGTQTSASGRPVDIYLGVGDVEASHAKLTARQVAITDPLTLQWWGDRTFKVMDPYGYIIWFYQKVGEPEPPHGLTLV